MNQLKHIFHNFKSFLFKIDSITCFLNLEICFHYCLIVLLDYQLTILVKYLVHLINQGLLMKYLINYVDKNFNLLIYHKPRLCISYLMEVLYESIGLLNLRHIFLLYHDNLRPLQFKFAIFCFSLRFKILSHSIFYEEISFYFNQRIF